MEDTSVELSDIFVCARWREFCDARRGTTRLQMVSGYVAVQCRQMARISASSLRQDGADGVWGYNCLGQTYFVVSMYCQALASSRVQQPAISEALLINVRRFRSNSYPGIRCVSRTATTRHTHSHLYTPHTQHLTVPTLTYRPHRTPHLAH